MKPGLYWAACAALGLAAACAHTADARSRSASPAGSGATPRRRATRSARWTSSRAAATRSATTARRCGPTTAARPGPASPPAPRRTSTRLQAVTPDVVDRPRRRRLRRAPLRRRRQDLPRRCSCWPRPTARTGSRRPTSSTRRSATCCCATATSCARPTSGQTFGRGTAIPGTPASAGGGQGVPADAIFTTPDAGIVFLAGTNTAFRTTDAGASWTPGADVDPAASRA